MYVWQTCGKSRKRIESSSAKLDAILSVHRMLKNHNYSFLQQFLFFDPKCPLLVHNTVLQAPLEKIGTCVCDKIQQYSIGTDGKLLSTVNIM